MRIFNQYRVLLETNLGRFDVPEKFLKSPTVDQVVIYACCFYTIGWFADSGGQIHYLQGTYRVTHPTYCVGELRNTDELLRDPDLDEDFRRQVFDAEDQWLWIVTNDGQIYPHYEAAKVVSTSKELAALSR